MEIGYILKIKPTGFTGGLDVIREQKRGIKDDSKVSSLRNSKNRIGECYRTSKFEVQGETQELNWSVSC